MPAMPVDISWQVLRQIIRDWAGASADLAEVKPLDGGSVSTTLALTTTSGDRAVLKITPHRVDRAYADEAFQLTLLRDVGVPAPRVYRWEIGTLDHPFSYLLMEYIDGSDLPAVRECCAADVFDQVQAECGEDRGRPVLLERDQWVPFAWGGFICFGLVLRALFTGLGIG